MNLMRMGVCTRSISIATKRTLILARSLPKSRSNHGIAGLKMGSFSMTRRGPWRRPNTTIFKILKIFFPKSSRLWSAKLGSDIIFTFYLPFIPSYKTKHPFNPKVITNFLLLLQSLHWLIPNSSLSPTMAAKSIILTLKFRQLQLKINQKL